MDEIRVILKKPVTFLCRIIAGMVMVAAPLLDAMKDKEFSDVTTMSLIILAVAMLGAATNTAAAWFSSSAEKARAELASDTKKEEKEKTI